MYIFIYVNITYVFHSHRRKSERNCFVRSNGVGIYYYIIFLQKYTIYLKILSEECAES